MADWITEWESAAEANAPVPAPLPEDEAQSVGKPSAGPDEALVADRTPPRTPIEAAKQRKRTRIYPIAIVAAAILVAVVSAFTLFGGQEAPKQTPSTPQAMPSTPPSNEQADVINTPAGLLECPQNSGDTRVITSEPGDITTEAGVIAAFEHDYFATRDPAAAAEHLAPSMLVTAAGIRQVMDDNFPAGNAPIPYCATITPWNGAHTWAVSVDWADERKDTITNWTAIYEVKESDGRLRIVRQLPAT